MEGNRDRGNIKWTSLFIPEHLERLREWQAEDDHIEQPQLDQFDWDNIQETLETALKRQCETEIETWQDGKITYYQGKIKEINIHSKTVIMEDPFGPDRIHVIEIVSVQCLD
ncbi:hypothetical protein CSV80_00955 [Sporosarcina sp. P12(2017)]|uniref:YolD-like family protein n=1 Tax=unclassified Sporosarcina TaxID=2647733 RepID=UPI000C16F132|nr:MULTISPECIES: YolD-like family protein [unclassified Sporosarcina]PIC59124.1 hypothetical protein CSV81_00955 [Sporosarcina sp. P10]PIC62445.1 hypothetical protein CSV80_00955 [Sporosarcina sp. P12(2017)]